MWFCACRVLGEIQVTPPCRDDDFEPRPELSSWPQSFTTMHLLHALLTFRFINCTRVLMCFTVVGMSLKIHHRCTYIICLIEVFVNTLQWSLGVCSFLACISVSGNSSTRVLSNLTSLRCKRLRAHPQKSR